MNKIKESIIFIKENKSIMVFLIISLFIIIKFSEIRYIVGTPYWIKIIFNKPDISSNTYEFYRIGECLSLSYVVTFIFYIIVEYIPSRQRSKSVLKVIENELIELYSKTSELIALMNLLCDIEGVNGALEKKNFDKIDSLIFKDEIIYYKCNLIINGITDSTTNNYINYRNDLFKYKEDILEKINKIVNTSNYSYCDYKLINIISEIQTNDFLERLLSIKYKHEFQELIDEEKYVIYGLGKSLYEFVKIHEKFKLFEFKKIEYSMEKLDNKEEERYKKKIKDIYRNNPELNKYFTHI